MNLHALKICMYIVDSGDDVVTPLCFIAPLAYKVIYFLVFVISKQRRGWVK